MESNLTKFQVVGLIPSPEYQKCKFIVEQLHHSFPEKFKRPELRPMLDVAWNEFKWKIRRKIGGLTWVSSNPVAVFVDNIYLGDDKKLEELFNLSYKCLIYKDFESLGVVNLRMYLEQSNRTYVYFVISYNGEFVGTLLFQLYVDLLPLTCDNFLRLCRRKTKGYKGSTVHRICKTSWVQIGGSNLKPISIACENYSVPHDRRGVLSMTNDGKHTNNSTQCIVSLDPTAWMDYCYVAFGQLVHGDEVLKRIENISTVHESPSIPIIIEDCGEYKFSNKSSPFFIKHYKRYAEKLDAYQKERFKEFYCNCPGRCVCPRKDETIYPPDFADPRDVSSKLNVLRYQQGLYSQK